MRWRAEGEGGGGGGEVTSVAQTVSVTHSAYCAGDWWDLRDVVYEAAKVYRCISMITPVQGRGDT